MGWTGPGRLTTFAFSNGGSVSLVGWRGGRFIRGWFASGAHSGGHGSGAHVARGNVKSHALLSKKYRILCRKMVCRALVRHGEIEPTIPYRLAWEHWSEPITLSHGEVVDVDNLFFVVATTKIVNSIDAFASYGGPGGIGDDK